MTLKDWRIRQTFPHLRGEVSEPGYLVLSVAGNLTSLSGCVALAGRSKMAICVLLLLLAVLPSKAQAPEGVELTALDVEIIKGGLSLSISGSIENNGPHAIEDPWIEVTLRKDDKIVGFFHGTIKPTTLRPGVTGRFKYENHPIEFNEYDYRIQGKYEPLPDYFTKIDEEDLPGAVEIIEGSQNAVRHTKVEDWTIFFTEVVNNTPAFISQAIVYITVYNVNEVILWEDWTKALNLHPGERSTVVWNGSGIWFEDVGIYELRVESLTRPYLLPTAVEATSWGVVKREIRE